MARRGGGGGGGRGRGGGGGGGGPASMEWDDAAFRAGLARALSGMKVRGTDGLQRTGIRVQNRARQLCPVDTGRLRASIQHKMGEDSIGPFVEIGTNVEYAPIVEFGGAGRRPRAYLRPALVEVITRGFLRGA